MFPVGVQHTGRHGSAVSIPMASCTDQHRQRHSAPKALSCSLLWLAKDEGLLVGNAHTYSVGPSSNWPRTACPGAGPGCQPLQLLAPDGAAPEAAAPLQVLVCRHRRPLQVLPGTGHRYPVHLAAEPWSLSPDTQTCISKWVSANKHNLWSLQKLAWISWSLQ